MNSLIGCRKCEKITHLCTLIIFPARHMHCTFIIVGCGVLGVDKTQAQQPHHLSCCRADTGAALSYLYRVVMSLGLTLLQDKTLNAKKHVAVGSI